MERSAKDTVVVHTHNVQMYSAAWLRAMLHPQFLARAQAILGPNVILHHTKLFQKPAEKGAPFPMHQDWGYFPTVQGHDDGGDHSCVRRDGRDGLPAGGAGLAQAGADEGQHGPGGHG